MQALDAALAQNPYLTALPSASRTTILAPESLDLTTGTAEIFRLQEVQDAIVDDFVVLPCDLLCEVSGRALWETWMTLQPPLSDRGGFGVWYDTKDVTENGVGVKKEETDFLATTDLSFDLSPPAPHTQSSLHAHVRDLAITMPTDTLKDELEEHSHLRIRPELLGKRGKIDVQKKRGKVDMQTKTRSAHCYFMPHWCKQYMARNRTFESINEDVIGCWAKATWQSRFSQKVGMEEALRPSKRRKSSNTAITLEDDDVSLAALSSTGVFNLSLDDDEDIGIDLASRVPRLNGASQVDSDSHIPAFLAYSHPSLYVPDSDTSTSGSGQKQKQPPKASQQQHQQPQRPPSQLIRRVDSVKLLLSCSLYLARLPSIIQALPTAPSSHAHPYYHVQQVHPTTALPSQATIATNALIDANCSLQPRITIKESVIGANCSIAAGSRILGCLLMDGVVIEEKVVLSGCVVGRRCKIEKGSELRDCSLQDGYNVSEGTTAKGEILAGFDEDDLDIGDDKSDGIDL